ncbi:MAG: hypothetical protein ACRDY7_08770 [Acidimicrobiia bacterium]
MRKRVTILVLCALIGTGTACGDDEESSAQTDDDSLESSESSSTSTSAGGGGTSTSVVEDAAPAFTEEEADTVLDYGLVDYLFEGPDMATGPKVYFNATNEAPDENHELEVLDPAGEALGEIVEMPPGESGGLALELEPGTYELQCIVETAEGKTHRELGMVLELTVK